MNIRGFRRSTSNVSKRHPPRLSRFASVVAFTMLTCPFNPLHAAVNDREAEQIKALAEATRAAKDAAYRKLDAMKVMLSPAEQRKRAEDAFLKLKAAEEQSARRVEENEQMSNFGPAPLSITSTKPNPRGYFR